MRCKLIQQTETLLPQHFQVGAQAGLLLFKHSSKHLNRSQFNGLHQCQAVVKYSRLKYLFHVSLQQFPKIQEIHFHTKITCCVYFLLICVNHVQLGNIFARLYPSDAWWETSDFSHQAQHVPTCHLSDARSSTLLDLVTSLHCLSSYRNGHNYIIRRGWAYECVSVGVCEKKVEKVPVLSLSRVFSYYRLVHKFSLTGAAGLTSSSTAKVEDEHCEG